MNKRRITDIRKMLEHYPGKDKYDIRATLTDVLADIMIMCRLETDDEGEELDFDDLCRVAESHCDAAFVIDSLEADTLQLEGYCHYDDEGTLHLNANTESDT
jgi:hypothetical protein